MRRLLLILPLIALLIVSCRKDDDSTVDLTAIIADQPSSGGAKVYIDDALFACWHNGDYVNVNGSSYTLSVEPGTLTEEHDWQGQKVATILNVAQSDNGYTAAYPIGQFTGIIEGGTTAMVTIPSLQTFETGTVYSASGARYQKIVNPMVAHVDGNVREEDRVMRFFNVGCLLRVKITNSTGYDLNMHYVTLSASSAYLAGTAPVNGIGTTSLNMSQPTSGYHGITVDCDSTPVALDDGADTVIYIVSAPFENQTLTLRVLAKDPDAASHGDTVYYTLVATSNSTLSLDRSQMGQVEFTISDCGCAEETGRCDYAFWGCGTRRHPFLITNKEDLLRFRGFTHLADGENNSARSLYARNTSVYYEQICDVDASDAVWTDNGQFWGHYNGGGYAIKLKLGSRAYPGLFASLSGATISNLTLTGDAVSISSSNILSAGVFCGDILRTSGSDKTVFENCVNRIPISARYTGSSIGDGASLNLVGGIVARAIVSGCKVTFRNCSNEASITGSTSASGPYIYTGGLLGSGYCDSVINCSNSGTIVGKSNTGGFIGHGDGSTTLFGNNTNTASVTGTTIVGGMVGYVATLLRINGVATNSGNVTGTGMNVGGILGKSNSNFTLSLNSHVTNSGVVSGTSYTGGIAGDVVSILFINQGVDVQNVSTGSVTGSMYVGGCVGYVGTFAPSGTTDFSFSNSANVMGSSSSVGGIIGQCYSSSAVYSSTTYYSLIYNCTNSGTVSSTSTNTGGIAGYAKFKELKYCRNEASGTVTGTANVGGIVGSASYGNSEIASSTNSGTVTGTNYVGGIVGQYGATNILTLTNDTNYSTGVVKGNQYVGGMLGGGRKVHMTDCVNQAAIRNNGSTSGSQMGGMAGQIDNDCNDAYFDHCTNTGSITSGKTSGETQLGGIVGRIYISTNSTVTIRNCCNTGNITGKEINGGLVGLVYRSGSSAVCNLYVYNSFVKGTLTGGICTCGIMGKCGVSTFRTYIYNTYFDGTLQPGNYANCCDIGYSAGNNISTSYCYARVGCYAGTNTEHYTGYSTTFVNTPPSNCAYYDASSGTLYEDNAGSTSASVSIGGTQTNLGNALRAWQTANSTYTPWNSGNVPTLQ